MNICKKCKYVAEAYGSFEEFECWFNKRNSFNGEIIIKGNISMNKKGDCPYFKERGWFEGILSGSTTDCT